MAEYIVKDGHLEDLTVVSFEKEKDIQELLVNNLNKVFGITHLKTQYSVLLEGKRIVIDALGKDDDNNVCILEFKKNKSYHSLEQGLRYYSFISALGKSIKKDFSKVGVDLSWKYPRVICIAEDFSVEDLTMFNNLVPLLRNKLNIMLYKFTFYDSKAGDKVLSISSISPIKPSRNDIDDRMEEIKHLYEECSEESIELTKKLLEEVLDLDDNIQVNIRKKTVIYSLTNPFFCIDNIHKGKGLRISVYLDRKLPSSPETEGLKVDDQFEKRGGRRLYNTGMIKITIKSHDDIDKALIYIKESYIKNK